MRSFFTRPALFALLLVVAFATVKAQKPLANHPFEPVEELFYDAEFNRSLLRGLDVAEFKLRSVKSEVPTADNSAKSYALNFSADVVSKGFFVKLFNLKFHEQIESTIDATTFTLQKNSQLDEQGKRVRTSETLYDRSKAKLSWTQRDPNNPNVEPRTAVVDFGGQLQDVLSVIYYLRTQRLEVGKTIEVFISDSGRVYRVPIKIVEKKKMKTAVGRVNTLRLDPQLFGPEGMLEDEKGEFNLWVTDDERHIPVSARVKTEYGTFDIKLKRRTQE
ncbi:MAG TPA: DUF3108 domain-containing protein [Pyrinomonadaceae bacterium]